MSLIALLTAASPMVPALSSPQVAQEIVVIGKKIKDWKGVWRQRKGVLSCRTTKSTGDREIDNVGCESLIACASPLVPAMQAIAAAELSKVERNRRLNEASQSIGPCLVERRDAGVQALAERRAAR